jgi:imidazole glycerol-phosphate synthase subunit HisH
MSKITVVDYGAGNLLSVVRALKHCGAEVEITSEASVIAKAEKLVFPGVGAFGDCVDALSRLGLMQALTDYIQSDRLFLGICVGMQVMFEVGEEFGQHKGLGILPGRVTLIPSQGTGGKVHKIPHIGWSVLVKSPGLASWKNTILEPLEAPGVDASMYFVHSFMGVPARTSDRLADVDYNGIAICAAVKKGNAYGVQFHPEKSGEIGLNVLRQFLQLKA